MRSFKFWGRSLLMYVGLTVGIALAMFVIIQAGEIDFGGRGIRTKLLEELSLYPYYLLAATGIIVLAFGFGVFQVYFPMLVSLNATRRQALAGVLGTALAIIATNVAIAALLQSLLPGAASEGWGAALPLMAGGLLLEGAFATVLGAVALRWGNLGRILAIVTCVVIAGCCGAGCVLVSEDFFGWADGFGRILHTGFLLPAIGLALYLAACVFAAALTGKIEVRM